MIERQKEVFGVPRRTTRCTGEAGDIVVCAPDPRKFRAQSTADVDP